jgi:hypothetical protein
MQRHHNATASQHVEADGTTAERALLDSAGWEQSAQFQRLRGRCGLGKDADEQWK